MKISTTFEIVKQSLYSVQYELYEVSEFRRLFDFWNNAELLYEYFQENKKDLDNHFWKGISIPSAVLKTRNEANEFENKLLKIADAGKRNKLNGLSGFFRPLVDGTIELKFEKDKAKWPYKRSWLRIYAIRMGVNIFVISGGGIKLTSKMSQCKNLMEELRKLQLVKEYLKKNESVFFQIFEIENNDY